VSWDARAVHHLATDALSTHPDLHAMPEITLYIAASLDGYIADRDGGIRWLPAVEPGTADDFGYTEFYTRVAGLVMGRATYEQVLGLGAWPYEGKPVYVLSRNPPAGPLPAGVEFAADADALAERMRICQGTIWLVGGGSAIAAFRERGLIDEYDVTVVPVLLGGGIRLFEPVVGATAEPLYLREAGPAPQGCMRLRYTRRPPATPLAGVEVECKYLLRAMPPAMPPAETAEVEQGWLPGERLAERLRRTVRGGETRWVRAVKSGRGVARLELEEETTRDVFEYLWPLTAGRRVRKRRHYVPAGTLTWEIDEFLDRELVLAEVELPAADHAVPIPDWLAPVLVREVTDEPAYLNLKLAR
jgi:dihydrofolate reductase/CYTH domain-containing protein